MRTRLNRVVAGLVGSWLAACSSGENADEGAGPSSIPLEQYCERYAQMTCRVAERCDCLGGASMDLCLSFQRAECAQDVEQPVAEGRYAFNPVAAEVCLHQLEAIIADCSLEGAYWPEACDEMLVGQVPEGGDCDSDSECVDSLECYDDQCTALPTDGQACLLGDCAADHFCGDDGRCHRERGPGQPCPEGAVACASDLYCDSRTETCERYLGAGQSCAHDSGACDDDLYCSTTSQICKPYPGSGQSCADSGGDCDDDLYCDDAQICQPQRPGEAPCTDDEQCLSWDCLEGHCEPDDDPDGVCDLW